MRRRIVAATVRSTLRRFSTTPSSDWRQFGWQRLLNERNWTTQSDNSTTLQALTRQLSFPLTVAHALPLLLDVESRENISLCVLGAREEADAVPMSAWLELAALSETDRINLSMIGPECGGDERSLSAGPLHVTQSPPICASFVDSPLGSALLSSSDGKAACAAAAAQHLLPDAFILFNPGLHAGKYSWRPSMELVLSTGRPVLLTAYSDQDAASDVLWLSQLGHSPTYVQNPWASLEPWSGASQYANQYYTVLNGRASVTGEAAAPRAQVVPTEQSWARRGAMMEFFDEGPQMVRQMIAEWRRS